MNIPSTKALKHLFSNAKLGKPKPHAFAVIEKSLELVEEMLGIRESRHVHQLSTSKL